MAKSQTSTVRSLPGTVTKSTSRGRLQPQPQPQGQVQQNAQTRRNAMKEASGLVGARRESHEDQPATPAKGRKGLKAVTVYLHPVAKGVLVEIANEQDKSLQQLSREAWNLLFQKYEKKQIA